jgi:hypothetical protein
MVTVSVSAPREEGFLTIASLVRTILVVEHDPSQGELVTQHFSFKPHHYANLVTSAAAALNFRQTHQAQPVSPGAKIFHIVIYYQNHTPPITPHSYQRRRGN